MGLRFALLSLLVAMGNAGAVEPSASPGSIIHRTLEDFRQGSLGDSGANVYISAKGRIQTIHRWDLNRDGELDLLFTQDHNNDYAPDAMIYWGGANGYESLLPELPQLRSPYMLEKHAEQARQRISWLPTLGGGRGQIADLNGDGYQDIVFCNTMHNYRQDMPVYIYWGSAQGFRESDRTVLPAYMPSGVAIGDLNGDGQPDIVIANEGVERGVEKSGAVIHKNESYIYWGGITGFPRTQISDEIHRTVMPTLSAADVAIGDFNGDQHPDIAFLNNDTNEHSIYVYWGDGTGRFSAPARQVIPLSPPGKVAVTKPLEMNTLLSADVNQDGIGDLIAAGKSNLQIYFGTKQGLSVGPGADLPADNGLGLEAADLNGDGHLDLIVANAGVSAQEPVASTIYWGSASGYRADHRTQLPTLGAATVKAADLNRDGSLDLLFGNSNPDTPAQIFWGGSTGFAGYRKKDLQGFGVVGAGIADLNADGIPDIVLINHLSGRGSLPTAIYWGNPEHYYSSASVSFLNPGGGMMHLIADLDDDGFPEVVLMESEPGQGVYIWWGSQSGYSAANRTRVPTKPGLAHSIAVADLDRDGHLDLVCGMAGEGPHTKVVIVYGNDKRFQGARTSEVIQLPGDPYIQAIEVADLNKDGHLDLIFPLSHLPYSEIWWGGANGYHPSRVTRIEANGACQAVVADMDRDGWLDVIFTSTRGIIKNGQPVQGGMGWEGRTQNSETYIYWGSPEGLKTRTEVESFTALDATVADFNRDGHLDIALSNYKSDTTRELPVIIYWGNGTREYSSKRRSLLDAASSSAIQALDLNRDGWPDLVVSNHQQNFSHVSGTNIYWGGPKGFAISSRTSLPTIGVHLDAMVDPGNIYSRNYEWDYVSAPIESPNHYRFAHLKWKAETGLGTAVRFQVRSAVTRADLTQAEWTGPSGTGSFYLESGSAIVGLGAEHRWLQYRAILHTPDGGNSPLLSEVEVVCTPR